MVAQVDSSFGRTLACYVFLMAPAFSSALYAHTVALMDEDFESPGLPTEWIAVDGDGDGYGWKIDGTATASTGFRCAASASYVNVRIGIGSTSMKCVFTERVRRCRSWPTPHPLIISAR